MIQEFTQFALAKIEIIFAADNKALVERMTQHQQYTTPYPNATLASEFDLTEEIYHTHKQYHISPKFKHVKGHQDVHTEYDKLPLLAQLNVEADEMASLFYKEGQPSEATVVPLLVCTSVLNIRGISITNNYKNQLMRAFTEPQYIGHIQHRFKWNNSVTNSIAWKSLSCAIRRINRPCLITKICNDMLPAGTRMKRFKFQSHDKCCLCGLTENTTHMFQCNDESRHQWRRQLITGMLFRLQQLNTLKGLSDTLCSAITDWLDNGRVSTGKYDKKYHKAIITQNHIGWLHIFFGHFSQEWEIIQGTTKLDSGRSRPPYLWGASVVELCLTYSIKLWEQRNKDVHGHNANDSEQLLKIKHIEEITRLQLLQPQTRPSDNFLFQGIATLKDSPHSTTMANWIASRRPAIYNSIKMAKDSATDNTHSLHRYFKPTKTADTVAQRLHRWTRNKLVYDPFSKKKRRKKVDSCQPKLTSYLSLRSIL